MDPNDVYNCISEYTAASDGTACGDGKWCYQGKCVKIEKIHRTTKQHCDGI